MPGSETPLSDMITRCVEQPAAPDRYQQFIVDFLRSDVGVIIQPIGPAAAAALEVPDGTQIVVGENQFGYGLSRLPDGRQMLLACADFHIFRRRFGGSFNATVKGRELLHAVWINPACQGIQVNSAVSEHSVTILRAAVRELLEGPKARKPWWRFWQSR